MTEVFGGQEVDELTKILKAAVRKGEPVNTPPMQASVDGQSDGSHRFIHTLVPVADESGSSVNRLFVYSEGVE